MSERAPSAKADPLGLAARGALGVLLESIRLEGSGIHLVLTDRSTACLQHVLDRSELPCTALFSGDDTRLADAAFAPPEGGQILVDVLDPRVEGRGKAVSALNIEREWLTIEGNHAVVILPGADRDDAADAYLALQRKAPDFWSLRTATHEAFAADDSARRGLLKRLSGHFPSSALAEQWLSSRDLAADWEAFRLWLPEQDLSGWLAAAAEAGDPDTEPDPPLVGEPSPDDPSPADSPQTVSFDPIGEPVPAGQWPAVDWPSGQFDPTQAEVVDAARAAFADQGWVRIYRHPDEEADVTARLALTVGLFVRSGRRLVVHLDAGEGLVEAVTALLSAVAPDRPAPDSGLDAAVRLSGALGSLDDVLLIATTVDVPEMELLRACLSGAALIFAVDPAAVFDFAVVSTPEHRETAEAVRRRLNRWALGAARLSSGHLPLDLRAAAARACETVLVEVDPALAERHGETDAWAPDDLRGEAIEHDAIERFGPALFEAHTVVLPEEPHTRAARVAVLISQDAAFESAKRGDEPAEWVTFLAATRSFSLHGFPFIHPSIWLGLVTTETLFAGALAELGDQASACVLSSEAVDRLRLWPKSPRRARFLVRALRVAANGHADASEFEAAASLYRQLEEALGELGDSGVVTDLVRYQRANSLYADGRPIEALAVLDRSLVERLERHLDDAGRAWARGLRVAALADTDRVVEAEEGWAELQERAGPVTGFDHGTVLCLAGYRLFLATGDPRMADHTEPALARLREIGSSGSDEERALLAEALANAAGMHGDRLAARRAVDESLDVIWPLFEAQIDAQATIAGQVLARARGVYGDDLPERIAEKIARFTELTGGELPEPERPRVAHEPPR